MEYDKARLAEYDHWVKTTEQFPISEFGRLALLPDVMLPADGSYYIVANNLDEIRHFLIKIKDLTRWARIGITKTVYVGDPGDEEEEPLEDPLTECYIPVAEGWEARVVRVMSYNQFFDADEQLHLSECAILDALKSEALQFTQSFLDEVTFPCLVQNSGEGNYDRGGDFEVNHCQVLNLPGISQREGPVQIHLRWI